MTCSTFPFVDTLSLGDGYVEAVFAGHELLVNTRHAGRVVMHVGYVSQRLGLTAGCLRNAFRARGWKPAARHRIEFRSENGWVHATALQPLLHRQRPSERWIASCTVSLATERGLYGALDADLHLMRGFDVEEWVELSPADLARSHDGRHCPVAQGLNLGDGSITWRIYGECRLLTLAPVPHGTVNAWAQSDRTRQSAQAALEAELLSHVVLALPERSNVMRACRELADADNPAASSPYCGDFTGCGSLLERAGQRSHSADDSPA